MKLMFAVMAISMVLAFSSANAGQPIGGTHPTTGVGNQLAPRSNGGSTGFGTRGERGERGGHGGANGPKSLPPGKAKLVE